MKIRTQFLILSIFLIFTNSSFAQATRNFTGKLVSYDGGNQIVKNVAVRLVNLGNGVTGTDGIFVIAINENVGEVTLELDSLNIVYPSGGRINVPKEPNAVVEFIIGKSPKDILTTAVANSNKEIKNRLKQLGVQQDGIEQSVNAIMAEIMEMTDIKLDDLRDQIELANKREQFYPVLASTINDYINEAKDLKDAFKFTARHAFDDSQALQILTNAIYSYNIVFEELNRNQVGYKKYVSDYWQSEAKASDVSKLFDDALGELHSANIFTLNLKVRDINNYNRGDYGGLNKKTCREIILRDIESAQLQLERRLEVLDKSAQIVLSKLAI